MEYDGAAGNVPKLHSGMYQVRILGGTVIVLMFS